MADLKKIFVEEAAEILAELEPKILEMEGRSSPQLLNDIFRLAHTLKGSAGIAGVAGVGSLAHHLEDLLEMVRDGEVGIEEGLVDLLLMVCDILKAMLLELEEGVDAQAPQELVEQLTRYAGRRQAQPPRDVLGTAGASAPDGPPGGEKTYRLTLDFGRDFFRRGHNLEYLLEDLAQLGRIDKIVVDAGRVPPLTELDPEDYWLIWEVTLTTNAGREEIIVKPLPGELKKLPTFLGAAVLGDGRVLLVLDPAELVVKALLDYQPGHKPGAFGGTVMSGR